RLLGADLAAIAAVTAARILGTALDVARHGGGVPAKLPHTALQNSLAGADPAVGEVDPKPLIDRVHGRGVLVGHESSEPIAIRPFLSQPVRTAKAGGVVDHGAATQAAARDQRDRRVGRR